MLQKRNGRGLGADGEVGGEVGARVEPEGDGDDDVEACMQANESTG